MNQVDFLGRGWSFPLGVDDDGAFTYTEGAEHIEQSLQLILMTALGERVMRPDFGCQAPDLVFAPGSVQYLSLLETSVLKAIRDWEPRVEVEAVDIVVASGNESQVIVDISYIIRGSNTRRNLVFPFYLGTEEANL